jgi:hypothetical protein
MRSISDVIRDVIDNTDAADIGTQAAADRLSKELIDALRAAGHPVTEPPTSPTGDEKARMHGILTLHLETPHGEGERHATADLKMDASVWLTPVLEEMPTPPGAGIWDHRPDVFVRYDVVIQGFTVPMDDRGTHLTIREVDG